MTNALLIALGTGAIVQSMATLWVLSVERGRLVLSTAVSMLYAGAMLAGVGESMRAGSAFVGYVVGSGIGSAAIVYWRMRGLRRGAVEFVPERRVKAK